MKNSRKRKQKRSILHSPIIFVLLATFIVILLYDAPEDNAKEVYLAEAEEDTEDDFYVDEEALEEQPIIYTYVDEKVFITSDILNVRIGPGTDFPKVIALGYRSILHRTAIGTDGWSRIELDGKEYYVNSSHLKLIEDE